MQTYVNAVVRDEIRIKYVPEDLQKSLLDIGARKHSDEDCWVLCGNDKKELAGYFAMLRDVGIAFSTGKEWNPSELFEYYRELGLLNGTYKKISWYGPGDWRVTEGN